MKLAAALIAATVFLSVPAFADESAHSPDLLTLLSAIDIVPSAAEIQSVSLEPEVDLFFAANDADLQIYLRRRAASLLSMFDSPMSQSFLLILAHSGPLKLRWIATYTYCRGWANKAPRQVLSFASMMLGSKEALIRDAVVRGLAYVESSAADALLRRQELTEENRKVVKVIQRIQTRRNRVGLPLK